MIDVEKMVREFYDNFGWQKTNGVTGEDKVFRQFSTQSHVYHDRAHRREIERFLGMSGKLLIAGCGDLPGTHIQIAQQFSSVCCLDISERALDIAKTKLGDKREYLRGSILEIRKPDNYFDAAHCAHVIYHIDKDLQSKAIRELLRVIRPGGIAVIIYSNPLSFPNLLDRFIANTPIFWRITKRSRLGAEDRPPLYFYAHALEWWKQFATECRVDLHPSAVISADHESEFFVNGIWAWCVYKFCSLLERYYPRMAIRYWDYTIVVLRKNGVAD